MALLDDILKVLNDGWALYTGDVNSSVYEELKCKKPKNARWFIRSGQMLCVGCKNKCMPKSLAGFQIMLPGVGKRFGRVMFADFPSISVVQLLETGKPLSVKETGYCLGLSEGSIRNMIDDGTLQLFGEKPIRICSESVMKIYKSPN